MRGFNQRLLRRSVVAASLLVIVLIGHFAWQAIGAKAQVPVALSNGDVNGDPRRDISDAVYLLSWLFLGGQEPVVLAQTQCNGEPLCIIPGQTNVALPVRHNFQISTDGEGSNNGLVLSSVDAEKREHTWVFFTADNPGQIQGNSVTLIEYPGAGSGHPASQRLIVSPSSSDSAVPPVVIDSVGRLLAPSGVTIGYPTDPAPDAALHVAGTTRVKVLEIDGGADLAEPFDVLESQSAAPGMVVCIDPERPGKLRLASKAYDRTVAGVISGAKGLSPGLTLSKPGSEADGSHPVALRDRATIN